jgi:hypothetical protein
LGPLRKLRAQLTREMYGMRQRGDPALSVYVHVMKLIAELGVPK